MKTKSAAVKPVKCDVCSFPVDVGEEFSMSQAVETIRVRTGYTLRELAELNRMEHRTLKSWSDGSRKPNGPVRTEFITRSLDPTNPPSLKRQRDMRMLHGLTWDRSKRRWALRFTVDRGDKLCGLRIKANIKLIEMEKAVQVRQAVLDILRQLKLTIRPRIQKRNNQSQ